MGTLRYCFLSRMRGIKPPNDEKTTEIRRRKSDWDKAIQINAGTIKSSLAIDCKSPRHCA